MAQEQFAHRQTHSLLQKLEELSHRSGVSRGQAFEDWLTAMICALAAETKEEEYLAMVERHKRGKAGKRGIDLMGQMLGELVNGISDSEEDLLGDLFQGSISYGEAAQFFTPASVCRLMAEMTVDPDARPTSNRPLYIHDPCCGSGRMLLEASRINRHAELLGQDIDSRCAKITAINLGLRGLYGWVVCGNALSGESQFGYRIGSFFHEAKAGRRRGVIRDAAPEQTPIPVISTRLCKQARDLFANEERAEAKPPKEVRVDPQIVEVPPWVARLERQLEVSGDEQSSPAKQSDEPNELPISPDTDPRDRGGQLRQKQLFDELP